MLIFNFSSNPWSLEYLKLFAINIPPWFCGKAHTQAFWPSPTFHGLAHGSLHTDPWVFSSAPNSSLGKPPFMLKLTFWKVLSKCLLMVSIQFSPWMVCFCLCPWRQALGVLSGLLSVLPQGTFFLAYSVPYSFHHRGLGIIGQYLV